MSFGYILKNHLKILTNVPPELITVIPMPPVPTFMAVLHVLVTPASEETELAAQVRGNILLCNMLFSSAAFI